MRIEEDGAAADAIAHLPLAQFTAKVGAGFRQYPRAGGVLVPRVLAGLARDLHTDALPDAQTARLRLGRAVVRDVAKVMRRLPADALALPLPPPSEIVARTAIEQRTRNVVERLVPFEGDRAWSVARYLRVPGFGPRCLTDVLAAREEQGRGLGESPPADAAPTGAPLAGIARRVRGLLPLTSAEVRALFPDEGFARTSEPLPALLRTFAAAGVPAPFRLVRRGGSAIAVAPGSAGLARVACEEASRQIAAWGLSTVAQVSSRVECLSESPVRDTIVRRVLVALPRLRWLDARMEWFSFAAERSSLGKAVARVVGEGDARPLDDVVAALGASSASARRTPLPVLVRYLAEIAGCEIVHGVVRRRGDVPARPRRGTG